MAISEHDQAILDGLARAREDHEELAELLSFYYDLYRVQLKAKARLTGPDVRDEMAMRWRLEGGIPQLTFEQLNIEPAAFARLVADVAAVLARHNPGWDLDVADEAPEELVALARQIFETWETLTSPGVGAASEGQSGWRGSPVALAVGFGLAPHLLKAADVILPELKLDGWVHGYCPVCGGRPNLALLEAERGARRLLCSRCNSLWHYSRVGCPYCKSKEKQTYYVGPDGVYRLYICPDCNRYLKTVDLRELHRKVIPEVERLLTVGMDLAAREEGLVA
jgi:FdhE protein